MGDKVGWARRGGNKTGQGNQENSWKRCQICRPGTVKCEKDGVCRWKVRTWNSAELWRNSPRWRANSGHRSKNRPRFSQHGWKNKADSPRHYSGWWKNRRDHLERCLCRGWRCTRRCQCSPGYCRWTKSSQSYRCLYRGTRLWASRGYSSGRWNFNSRAQEQKRKDCSAARNAHDSAAKTNFHLRWGRFGLYRGNGQEWSW